MWVKRLLPAAVLALGAWGSAAAVAPTGFIVRLKDAPAHEMLPDPARHRLQTAGASGSPPARAAAERQAAEQARWARVLSGAGLGGSSGRRAPTLHAVGRDQQRLDFGRRLSRDEVQQIAQRLAGRPEVAWAEPDTREQRLQVPTDPLFGQQWWLAPHSGSNGNALPDRRRGVPGVLSAWQSGIPGSLGVPAAVVAVLDTGVTAHPDLAGSLLPGHDFVSESVYANDGDGRDADPSDPGDWVSTADLSNAAFEGCEVADSSWHGTIIAGIVAAASDNGVGVAGIHRDGRVLPVRVAGKCGAALSDIIDGMRWAAGVAVPGVPRNLNPARILNISFGGNPVCGPAYQEAVDELRRIGVVVVAAAGNAHAAQPNRPASCIGAVGVVALNRDGFKSHYSSFGAGLAATGIATVGGDDAGGRWGPWLADGGLTTVWNDGRRAPGAASYASLFGTSFSTPVVAGTIGLMLSVNPSLSWQQITSGLRLAARPHVVSPHIGVCSDANPGRCLCTTATCGAGIVDAEQALRFAQAPETYVPPARQAEVIDHFELVQAAALGPDRPAKAGSSSPPTGGADPAPTPVPGSPAGGGGGAAGAPGWWLGLLVALLALQRRAGLLSPPAPVPGGQSGRRRPGPRLPV